MHRNVPTMFIALLGALMLQGSSSPGQLAEHSVIGVWQPISIDSVGARPRKPSAVLPVVGPVGPGLLIFAKSHYAQVGLQTSAPRPSLPDSNRSVADLLATWGAFGGSAGAYSVRGDTLFARPTVEKNPRTMGPNFRWRFGIRIAGDTLWMTNVAEMITRRFVRVE